ncbi:MAG: hypothetical protein VX000_02220, partial [Myxococcota bacterium]|nr:hypothetical protein [Myxococcota bacterium]
MPGTPRRTTTWKKASFAALVTVIILGGCELGLRGAGWGPAYQADFAGWRMPADMDDHIMDPP